MSALYLLEGQAPIGSRATEGVFWKFRSFSSCNLLNSIELSSFLHHLRRQDASKGNRRIAVFWACLQLLEVFNCSNDFFDEVGGAQALTAIRRLLKLTLHCPRGGQRYGAIRLRSLSKEVFIDFPGGGALGWGIVLYWSWHLPVAFPGTSLFRGQTRNHFVVVGHNCAEIVGQCRSIAHFITG